MFCSSIPKFPVPYWGFQFAMEGVLTELLSRSWRGTQQLPAKPASWNHDLYTYRRETIELLF